MKFELEFVDLSKADSVREAFDPELDNVVTILSEVCGALNSAGELTIEGFGLGRWYTDIRTDLAILLEYLPVALKSISDGRNFDIVFFEQGLERQLEFVAEGDEYVATGRQLKGGQQELGTAIETIGREQLSAMLSGVMDEFLRALRELYPYLLTHPWMRDWLDGKPVW